MKKICTVLAAAFALCMSFSACKVDVNQIASNFKSDAPASESNTSSVSSKNSEFSRPESKAEPEIVSEAPTENPSAFDTSAYQTYYVTGSPSVSVYDNAETGGKIIGNLDCTDSVSFISSSITGYTFIYSQTLGAFGYIDSYYICPDYSEATPGQTYYIKDNNTPVYNDQFCSEQLRTLDRNDTVTVMAKVINGYWLIRDKNESYGYVSFYSLSEEKVKKKDESKPESKTESTNENNYTTGYGDAPESGYAVYKAIAQTGYLALRTEKNASDENIIGELYYGDLVYVIDSSGYYWYVYSPGLGMYGYVNSEYVTADTGE
ncbi:MAG: SH3 domain-containing protein [Clostridia bacterium]|nr:SH3 domain-containing protein [Clostridia bacterium]